MITSQIIQPTDLFVTADHCLLAPDELDTDGLQHVLGQILSHRVEYADIYFQYTRAEGWALEEGIVKSGSFNIDQGVGVRALAGENAPLGVWFNMNKSPFVGCKLHKPVTVGASSYSSSCGYKLRSPLRGRSLAKMMRSSVP